MRAVIDTNVWVSALINATGAPARVLEAVRAHRFELVISEPLLKELAVVLVRPRFAQRFQVTVEKQQNLLRVLREEGSSTAITGSLRICRGPKDDMVIETAINGSAAVLVSRDDDLKRSPEVAAALAGSGVRVLTVQHFLDALNQEVERAT